MSDRKRKLEFEDTEQDCAHENLDQNDGFSDCPDLNRLNHEEEQAVTECSKDLKVTFDDDKTIIFLIDEKY